MSEARLTAALPAQLRHKKLAERLAEQVSARIADENLTEGEPLGSEAELAASLGASRWTVREALHILEREHTIDIRRGRYGGLFVAAPSIGAVGGSIRSYLEFIRVTTDEIIVARRVLDEAMLEHATARVRSSDVAALRSATDLESEIEGVHAGFVQYEVLLRVARSPVLQSFVRAVGDLGVSAILRSTLDDDELGEVMRSIRLRRQSQIEAVIAGRLGDALQLETAILDAAAKLLRSATQLTHDGSANARLRALHFLGNARRFKRPELLAQEIASDIVARGWPVGLHLGTEAELLARYNVSRSAFREALRSLEQIGVVEMRSGRRSGLKISAPDPATVIRSARRHFVRLGASVGHLREALLACGVAAAGLAAGRMRDAAQSPAEASNTSTAFLESLGKASGNRIMSLLLSILSASLMDKSPVFHDDPEAACLRKRMAVEQAIRCGDAALARRCLIDIFADSHL